MKLHTPIPKEQRVSDVGNYTLLVVAMFLWGGSWVAGKIAAEIEAPLTVALWRFIIASLLLLPTLWMTQRPRPLFEKADIPNFFFLGAVGMAGYNFFFLTGLRYTTASSGALIAGSNPILIATFSILFLREPFRPQKAFGFTLGMIGVVLVIGVDALEGTGWEGNLLIFIGMIAWATYSTRLKQLMTRYSSLQLTTYSVVCGTLILFPLAILEGNSELYGTNSTQLSVWAAIVYLAIFATYVALVIFNRGIDRVGASRTAIFINLVPIFGSLLAVLLLGETITILKILGLVFVIGGVLIITRMNEDVPPQT